MKFLVLGHARHGKDTVAERLAISLKLSYKGSSEVCAEFIKDKLGYDTAEECFKDRVNHRAEWHKLIAEYCVEDKARLGRLIYQDNDIYCGIRAQDEVDAVIEEFDPFVIWVDATGRCPLEPADSMQLTYNHKWLYVDNNRDRDYLVAQITVLTDAIRLMPRG